MLGTVPVERSPGAASAPGRPQIHAMTKPPRLRGGHRVELVVGPFWVLRVGARERRCRGLEDMRDGRGTDPPGVGSMTARLETRSHGTDWVALTDTRRLVDRRR